MALEQQVEKLKHEGKNIVWYPQDKQAQALECPAYELLFGGAAGGGKTDFLLADYVAGVPEWGKAWRGIIFRRTYPELEEVILRAKELYLPVGAVFHEQKKTFTFPNGAWLRMRSLDSDQQVHEYQGHQYTWIGFDELGNYATDFCWTYMSSRCRSAAGAPCYMRGTANPGGTGHAWIKNRFIEGFESGKIYTDAEGMTRCFIPSRLEDNLILTGMDPDYEKRLNRLPGHLRRALREGDWDIVAGQYFDEWTREKHVCKPFPLIQGSYYKLYAFDWGYNKPYALVKLAISGDGQVFQYGELYGCLPGEINKGTRESSPDIARKAKQSADLEGVTDLIADPSCWNKQDGYPAVIDAFVTAGFQCVKANNDRVPGWTRIHELLKTEDEHHLPMLQVFDTCLHTIRTLPILLPDPHKPEDVDSSLEDHLADALRYGVMSQPARFPMQRMRSQPGIRIPPKRWDTLRDNGF
jgi:hypothetical protein